MSLAVELVLLDLGEERAQWHPDRLRGVGVVAVVRGQRVADALALELGDLVGERLAAGRLWLGARLGLGRRRRGRAARRLGIARGAALGPQAVGEMARLD